MKQLSQFIALNIPGVNTLQVMIVIATAFIFLRMAVAKFLESRRSRKLRRNSRKMENNMWIIE